MQHWAQEPYQKNISDNEGEICSDLTEEKQKSGEDVHFGPPLILGAIQYHETHVWYLLKCLQGVAKGDPMYLGKSWIREWQVHVDSCLRYLTPVKG